jgi:hypothetical protein
MRTEKHWANLSRFNHRRRYKCLEGSFDGWPEGCRQEAILEVAEYHDQIEPVFGVGGRYYDRYTKRAWEEFILEDGTLIACLDSEHTGEKPGFRREYFLYDLGQESHRPLGDKAASALRLLVSEGLASKEDRDLYHRDCQWKHVEELTRSTALASIKFQRGLE